MKVTGPVVPPTPPTPPSQQMGPLPPEDVRYAAIEHGLGSAVADTGKKVVSAPPPVGAVGSKDPAVIQQELQYLGDLAQLSLLYAQKEGQCVSPYGTNGSSTPVNPNIDSEISALTSKIQAEFNALPTGDSLISTTSSLIASMNQGDWTGFTNVWASDGASSVLMANIFGVGQTPPGGWMNNLSNLQLGNMTPQQQSQAAMNVYMLQLSAMAFEPQMYESQLDTNFWGQPAGDSMANNFTQLMYAGLWMQDGGSADGKSAPNSQQFGTDLVNLGYMIGAVWAGMAKSSTGNFPNFSGQGGVYMTYYHLLQDVVPNGPGLPSGYTATWPPAGYTWPNNPAQVTSFFISQVFEPMYHP